MKKLKHSHKLLNTSKIHSIIFDWKRTLYDPDTKKLINGSKDLLKMLKDKNIPLFLIGKGNLEMLKEVGRLGIKDLFADISFVEGNKNTEQFEPFIDKDNPKSSIVIGDRVQSELSIGKSLHTTTIWVKQGKFADEIPLDETQTPTYTVQSLQEVKELLKRTISQGNPQNN